MILYRITPAEGRTEWHGTRDQAQAEGRRIAGFMMKTRIEQCHVRDDKEGLVAALNGRPILGVPGPARAWQFTKRGGLVEVGADGHPLPSEAEPQQHIGTAVKRLLATGQPQSFSMPDPYQGGRSARQDGHGAHMNPWPKGSPEHDRWADGWTFGQDDEPALDPKAPALQPPSAEEQRQLDEFRAGYKRRNPGAPPARSNQEDE